MKSCIALATPVLVASMACSTVVHADGLFVLVDDSVRLPPDPGADLKDTLDVELADVDGDLDLDIFLIEGFSSAAGFRNLLWINDGSGHFTDETSTRLPAVANNSTEIDLADVDGDGDLDAVVANLGANQLLINDGTGVYTEAPLPGAIPPSPPGFVVPFPPFFVEVSAEAIFVDIDGDGDQDIAVSNENPFPFGPPGDANRLLVNEGDGTFFDESTTRLPKAIENTSGIAPGDIDADGDIDLIIGNIGQNRAYINSGSGVFEDETTGRLPPLDDSTRKVVLGDVDGDGDLDLVVGNSRQEQDRLYMNDGTGVFVDATAGNLPLDTATNSDIDLVDLNDDGSLDIIVTNVGDFVSGHGFLGEPNRLLFNDGDGRFRDATFPRLADRDGRSTNAELGDIDGDGVVDLVVANSGGVDRPDLPPPDGAERLFIRRDCGWNATLCHQTMLDGIRETVADVDTAAFPDGDMTSSKPDLNATRQSLLGRWASNAQGALDAGKAIRFDTRLRQIARRADGMRSPPDWIAGDVANELDGYSRFSIEVLSHHGL